MIQPNLGRLEQIELRNIWTSEPGDFTPWLAQEENLRLLGDTIGVELELEAQEQSVGPFSADLLCKNTANDSWVLIENQLERTDHTHLGQLLTYAAGLQAVSIVWIAKQITEQHRAALDWLNEITAERFQFFGLEIEVWKIGDSQAAPKFNIVSKPNDWVRDVTRDTARLVRAELTDVRKLQLEFWTGFSDYCSENEILVKVGKPQAQNWINFGIGRAGFKLEAVASMFDSVNNTWNSHEIRAELYIDGIDAKAHYLALEGQRDEIERSLERRLHWYNPDNARACRVYTSKLVDLNDRTRWKEYHEWLRTELNKFSQVFRPLVANLEP